MASRDLPLSRRQTDRCKISIMIVLFTTHATDRCKISIMIVLFTMHAIIDEVKYTIPLAMTQGMKYHKQYASERELLGVGVQSSHRFYEV